MPRPYRYADVDGSGLPAYVTVKVNRVTAREFVVSLATTRDALVMLEATMKPFMPFLLPSDAKAAYAALDAARTSAGMLQTLAGYLRMALTTDEKRRAPGQSITAYLPENVDVRVQQLVATLDEAWSDYADAVQNALAHTNLEAPVDRIARTIQAGVRRIDRIDVALQQAMATVRTATPASHYTRERKRA